MSSSTCSSACWRSPRWTVSYWFWSLSSSSSKRSASSSALAPPPPATSATTLLLLPHVPLVGLLGLLEEHQGPLLGGQGLSRSPVPEQCLRRLHVRHRLRQELGDLLEAGIRLGHAPGVHLFHQRGHFLTDPRLGQSHAHRVLAERVGGVGLPITEEIEGRSHDLALEIGKAAVGVRRTASLAWIAALPLALLPALLLVGLTEIPPEGSNVDEVDVAHGLAGMARPVIPGHSVVRHQVARVQLPLLQEEGVPRGHLRQRVAPFAERGAPCPPARH